MVTPHLWGHGSDKPHDGRVRVWIDPSRQTKVLTKAGFKRDKDLDEELDDKFSKLRQDTTSSGIHRLGNMNALSKAKRLLVLKQGVADGIIVTAEDALNVLYEITSLATIESYLYDLNINLYSESMGKQLGPTDDVIANTQEKAKKHYVSTSVYYDGDPDEGGQEITHEEYIKIKQHYEGLARAQREAVAK